MKMINSLIIDSNEFEEESHRKFRMNEDSNIKGMYKYEKILPPIVKYQMNPSLLQRLIFTR